MAIEQPINPIFSPSMCQELARLSKPIPAQCEELSLKYLDGGRYDYSMVYPTVGGRYDLMWLPVTLKKTGTADTAYFFHGVLLAILLCVLLARRSLTHDC